jgi:thiosulfate dehydrogenase [quinone] large subunit
MKTMAIARFVGSGVHVEDPPLARLLFADTRLAWLWLLLRLYVGYEWITAGLHKLDDPKWMVDGTALLGYWKNAVAVPAAPARAAITYDWFRSFLQLLIDSEASVWMAKVIAFGELAIGLGLIVGAFVGVAAFFGALMNMNFMLAGSASTNPVLFFLAVGLMLAWKVAGYYGADRVLLPLVGTPWHSGDASDRPTGGRFEPIGSAVPLADSKGSAA